MLKLDTKHQVLVALYTEYQKDLPNMKSINAEILELDDFVFGVAIEKLQIEGYITNADIIDVPGEINPVARVDHVKLTREGINFVEEKLGINPIDSAPDKVKTILSAGLNRFEGILVKIAAELIKEA